MMNGNRESQIERWKYLLLGMALAAFLIFLFLHPRTENSYDTEMVEVMIVEKEITSMDGKDVYLIHGKNQKREQKTFQITEAALRKRFEEAEVFDEIKTGKYYKFKITDKETYDSYYPSICGAVKLIDGFSPESSAQ